MPNFPRRPILGAGLASLATMAGIRPASARPDSVRFVTDWYAQAEHGGFYQALATGLYRQAGLDVTIQMGGTGVNILQLLAAGAVDFAIGSALDALAALDAGLPLVTVAAIFQKNPQCLLTHPNITTWEQLKGKPIFVSAGANVTYWPLLRAKYGFGDDQKRPYNGNLSPFLRDEQAAQQGYITAEPFKVEREGGFRPTVLLLADLGFNPYATTIETSRRLLGSRPDLVQRFVAASIQGWYSYLKDPQPGNALIRRDNSEMSEDLLAYGLDRLKAYDIITGGDGIGAMTEARWRELFETMVRVGRFRPDLPYQQAYTTQFVGKSAASPT